MSCSNSKQQVKQQVALRIVDVETCQAPLAVGDDVSCSLNAETRQIVFGEVPLTIKNVFVMNSKPGWTLSLDLRGLGVPFSILLAMGLWGLPMDNFVVGGILSTWGIKAVLWVGLSIPLLLRRGRQQLAIELADENGVVIVETHDTHATAHLLNI